MRPAFITAVLMFSQTPADAIAGGAGWVGTGLLGAVLGWLLFRHLPAKDSQLERLIADHQLAMATREAKHEATVLALAVKHDMIVKDISVTFAERTRDQRQDFKEALAEVLTQNGQHIQELAQTMREQFAQLHHVHAITSDPEFRGRTAAQNDILAQEAKGRKRP